MNTDPLYSLEKRYSELKTKNEEIQSRIKSKRIGIAKEQRRMNAFLQARTLFKSVAKMAQGKIKNRIESLVTMAIQSIYDRPFEYVLQFKETKNNIYCIPVIKEGERIYKNIERDLGGGIIDIISFSQKIVFWSMNKAKSFGIFILDEPFKNLGVLSERASVMLNRISKKLKLQFIITTHDENLKNGDRLFHVERKNKISRVTVEK